MKRQLKTAIISLLLLGGLATAFAQTKRVTGQWDFNNSNLVATVGNNLEYVSVNASNFTTFGRTGDPTFTYDGTNQVKNIHGVAVNVMCSAVDPADGFPGTVGYIMRHGILPKSGDTYVNQWTMIMDMYWGYTNHTGEGAISTAAALFSISDTNLSNDADMYDNYGAFGKGCCSPYNYSPVVSQAEQWQRLVFTADMSATPPRLAKYINGVKQGGDAGSLTTGNGIKDGRFSLRDFLVLFGDGDNEKARVYVNSLQIRDGKLSDAQAAALGGPSAQGIPLGILVVLKINSIVRTGSNVTISWNGEPDIQLQKTASLSPPAWVDVAGSLGANSVTELIGSTNAFYRLSRP